MADFRGQGRGVRRRFGSLQRDPFRGQGCVIVTWHDVASRHLVT